VQNVELRLPLKQ